MSQSDKLRQEILNDFFEPLKEVCSLKISEILIFKYGYYQLPENFSAELFSKTKISAAKIILLMTYVEKIAPAVSFSDDGDEIKVDRNILNKIPIEEKHFTNLKKGLKIIKTIIKNPLGKKLFTALLLTLKQRKDLDDLGLLREIIKLKQRELQEKEFN